MELILFFANADSLPPLVSSPKQKEWGWEVFQSIEKYCKTRYGYGSLKNVDRPDSIEDRMESFFLAETLKYLHLLFDPDSEIDILNKVRRVYYFFPLIWLLPSMSIPLSCLHDDDLVSLLLQHVFNTEAHPLTIFEANK